MSKLKYYSKTFVGRRKNNQDSCYANQIFPGTYLFAVADGMGGSAGGEIASSIAIKVLCDKVIELKEYNDLKQILKEAFSACHKSIKDKIDESPELNGMGTTLSCLLVKNNKYVWANIGDSRIYYINNQEFKQITVDHSYIQEYKEEKGEEPPLELVNKFGNLITKVLDGNNDEPDIFPVNSSYKELNENEIFVLCSDGLIVSKANDCEYIRDYMIATKYIEKSANELISFAYHNDSSDNITVVVVESGKVKRKRIKLPHYKSLETFKKKKLFTVLNNRYVFGFIFVLLLLFGFYFIFDNKDDNNKGKRGKSKSEVSNSKKVSQNVTDLKPEPFSGFEKTSMTIYLDNPKHDGLKISWHQYINDNHLLQYKIEVDMNEFHNQIELSKKATVSFNELGISEKGMYSLKVNAFLKDGKVVPGKRILNLEVRAKNKNK